MTTFTSAALDWLACATNYQEDSMRITPMRGANSSAVFGIENLSHPRVRRFVLRVFTDQDWLRREPDLPYYEAAGLIEAEYCNVTAPRRIASTAQDIGFGGPVVLMSRVQGKVELQPNDLQTWIIKLARALANIHAHKAPKVARSYRIRLLKLKVPTWTKQPQLWERAFELWRAWPSGEKLVFLHGDYHPCNVLWRNSKVSGVVDWVNACYGPRSVDVAHCRTNLMMMYGAEAADEFRDAYLAVAGGTHHPFWDVNSILDMSLPQPEFYRPWSEFGLQEISVEEMGRRNEVYLESVLRLQ